MGGGNEREPESKPTGDGRWEVAAPFLRLGCVGFIPSLCKNGDATRGARSTPGGSLRGARAAVFVGWNEQ